MPEISIVIPLYNAAAYIRECLDSIITPEILNRIEVIIVNDGSTDESPEIVGQYTDKFNNIKLINQRNQGASVARNTGVANATGRYILFVDSDDWINTDTLKYLVAASFDVDIVFLEASKVYPNGASVMLNEGYNANCISNRTRIEVLEHLSSLKKFPGIVWNKLIKREFLLQNDIIFNPGIIAEDIEWAFNVFNKAETYDYCALLYYFYRQEREGSITYKVDEKHIVSLLSIIENWHQKLIDEPEVKPFFEAFMAYEYVILLLLYGQVSKEIQKRYDNRIEQLKFLLLSRPKERVYQGIYTLLNLIGINKTAKLLCLYNRLKVKRNKLK